jgi:hypothetical protein
MSAPDESKQLARVRANNFVAGNLVYAQQILCNCPLGLRQAALVAFGEALHTVQDSTSPAHWGFQTWYGIGLWGFGPKAYYAYLHVKAKNFDPGPNSNLDKATADLWKYFQCSSTSPPLPSDFFKWNFDIKPTK